MKKYLIKTSATVVLSFSLLLSGVSVTTPCNPVAVAKKSAPVSLAKNKFSLAVKQNANKKTYSTAKIKVKKIKGVKIKKISYYSDTFMVAGVNAAGKITAYDAGAAAITVTVKYTYKNKNYTKKLKCKVRVKLTYKNIFKAIRFNHKTYATYVGNSEGICPCYKSDVKLDETFYAWNCLKMDVADTSVIEQGINGYVLAKKVGETTVTIHSTDGTNLTDTATVKVYASAADIPPQEDLYESEKSEFMEQLEGRWTEEEKQQFIDEDGNVRWDYVSESDLQYAIKINRMYDEYLDGKITDHPDGSAKDVVLSLYTTRKEMLENKDSDQAYFDVLKEKIVKPIMDSKNLSELKDVCASMSDEGIYPIIGTGDYELYRTNEDVIRAIDDGMEKVTKEPLDTEEIGLAKVDADAMADMTFINGANKDKVEKEYIKAVLGYMGITDAATVKATQKFIVDAMNAVRKKSEFQDHKTINKLDKKYPNIGLKDWMDKTGYSVDGDSVVLFLGNTMMKQLDTAFKSEKNLTALKGYAVLSAVKELMPYSRKGLQTSVETFFPEMFKGETKEKIAESVEGQLAENAQSLNNEVKWDIDQAYTDKFYSKTYKKEFENMVDRFAKTYREAIENCEMSKTAKESMLKKLDNMHHYCLYPTAEEYQKLRVQKDLKTADEGGTFADTVLAIREYRAYLDRLVVGKITGSTAWLLPSDPASPDEVAPWTSNAFFQPYLNVTVFCHVCLAPIFEDNPTHSEKTDVKNIAYMATTIGHEIGHAFDPTGSCFNEKGQIQKIWEDSDEDIFDKKMKKVVDFYSAYVAFISDSDKTAIYQNGDVVKEEATADLGGAEIALKLLKKTYPNNDEYIRQFFIMFARQWISTTDDNKPAEELEDFVEDVHPQSRARANIVSFIDEFYRVFDVKETDAMYIAPEDRVELWK